MRSEECSRPLFVEPPRILLPSNATLNASLRRSKRTSRDRRALNQRQRVRVDPRRVQHTRLAFHDNVNSPGLLAGLNRDLPGAAVDGDIEVHRSASIRARCAQRESAPLMPRPTDVAPLASGAVGLDFSRATSHNAAAIAAISSSLIVARQPCAASGPPSCDRPTSCRTHRRRTPATRSARGKILSSWRCLEGRTPLMREPCARWLPADRAPTRSPSTPAGRTPSGRPILQTRRCRRECRAPPAARKCVINPGDGRNPLLGILGVHAHFDCVAVGPADSRTPPSNPAHPPSLRLARFRFARGRNPGPSPPR